MPQSKRPFGSFLTSLAAFITAIGGLLVVLDQVGIINFGGEEPAPARTVVNIENNDQINLGNDDEDVRLIDLEERLKELETDERNQKEQELRSQIQELEARLQEQADREPSYQNRDQFTGTYQHSGNQNLRYEISQFGNQVSFKEITSIFGVPMVSAAGQGTIYGNRLEIEYSTTIGGMGRAVLQLSNDRISGHFQDLIYGNQVPIQMYRTSRSVSYSNILNY